MMIFTQQSGIPISRTRGLTLLELLFCLVALVILAGLTMPTACHLKQKSPCIHCLSNQKQVALAFLLWVNDVGKAFPMELPVEKGGTQGDRFQHDIVGNYLAVSNELDNPRLLACPSDKQRKPAESFAQLRPQNVSYFLNRGARSECPSPNGSEVLVGDRHITLDRLLMRGYVETATTNAALFGWANAFHGDSGNTALEDGSAHMANTRMLGEFIRQTEPVIRFTSAIKASRARLGDRFHKSACA
jgi:hypothetical protein